MVKILLVFLLALMFLLLGVAAYYYRGFTDSRARHWKLRVTNRHSALRRILRVLEDEDSETWDHRPLEHELFSNYLQTRNLDGLLAYGGLGRGTLQLLQAAGYRNIRQLSESRLERIHGIGPAKDSLIRLAVQNIVRQMNEVFRRGDCEQGRQYTERLRANREREALERAKRAPKIRALQAAVEESNGLIRDAERITYLNFVLNGCIAFTNALAERELPSAEEILESIPAPSPPPPIPVPRPAYLPPPPAPPPVATAIVANVVARSVQQAPPPPPPRIVAKSLSPAHAPDRPQPATVSVPVAPAVAPPEHPQLPLLRAMAALGLLMARADGSIAPEERSEVRRFLGEQYGSLLPHLDSVIDAAERRGASEMDVLMGLATHCTTPTDKLRAYNFALRVADAAGGRHARELALLGRLRECLGLTDLPPLTEEPWPRARIVLPSPPPAPRPARPVESVADSPPLTVPPASQPDIEPLRCWAKLGVLVARADGRMAAAERFVVRQHLIERFGRDLRMIPYIDPELERAEIARPMELVVMKGIKDLCPEETERREAYRFAEKIADASNGRSPRELEILDRMAEMLELHSLVRKPMSVSEPWIAKKSVEALPVTLSLQQSTSIPPVVEASTTATVLEAAIAEPAGFRDNQLLDDVFGNVAEAMLTASNTTAADLRQNDILDSIFGV